MKNPILAAAEQKIESQLTPQNRADYMKIVVAGMHAALAGGPNGMLGGLKTNKDPIEACAKGACGLCWSMSKESTGVMPIKAMIPAGMTLMLHGLDFIDSMGLVKIGNPELVRASTIYANTMLQMQGITPPMLSHAMDYVHQTMQDPQKMELIKRAGGASVAPGARVATPAGVA